MSCKHCGIFLHGDEWHVNHLLLCDACYAQVFTEAVKRSKGSKDAARSYCDDSGYSDGGSAKAEQGSILSLTNLVFDVSSAATMLDFEDVSISSTEDSFSRSGEDATVWSDEVAYSSLSLRFPICSIGEDGELQDEFVVDDPTLPGLTLDYDVIDGLSSSSMSYSDLKSFSDFGYEGQPQDRYTGSQFIRNEARASSSNAAP